MKVTLRVAPYNPQDMYPPVIYRVTALELVDLSDDTKGFTFYPGMFEGGHDRGKLSIVANPKDLILVNQEAKLFRNCENKKSWFFVNDRGKLEKLIGSPHEYWKNTASLNFPIASDSRESIHICISKLEDELKRLDPGAVLSRQNIGSVIKLLKGLV